MINQFFLKEIRLELKTKTKELLLVGYSQPYVFPSKIYKTSFHSLCLKFPIPLWSYPSYWFVEIFILTLVPSLLRHRDYYPFLLNYCRITFTSFIVTWAPHSPIIHTLPFAINSSPQRCSSGKGRLWHFTIYYFTTTLDLMTCQKIYFFKYLEIFRFYVYYTIMAHTQILRYDLLL